MTTDTKSFHEVQGVKLVLMIVEDTNRFTDPKITVTQPDLHKPRRRSSPCLHGRSSRVVFSCNALGVASCDADRVNPAQNDRVSRARS